MSTPEVISRNEAALRGLKRFYTGKPCKHGHYSERYVYTGNCIACQVRQTPRRQAPRTPNVCWPTIGLISTVDPMPQPEEIEAAFRMIEAYGWLDHCILKLRTEPELLEQFVMPPTHAEKGPLIAQVEQQYMRVLRERERQERIVAANKKRLAEEEK